MTVHTTTCQSPTLMYIHGYGSTGNALKSQQLQAMFPQSIVLSPTIDYDNALPSQIQLQLRQLIEDNDVRLIVGSSFGGYHALCSMSFFEGVVWCVNPVHDINAVMRRKTAQLQSCPDLLPAAMRMAQAYADFDRQVFCNLHPRRNQLHLALSLHDEVLGDHSPLLRLFPSAAVYWKNNDNHKLHSFPTLQADIAKSLALAIDRTHTAS